MAKQTTTSDSVPDSDDHEKQPEPKDKFGFEPTLWTRLIGPAGSPDDEVRLEALARLLEKYQRPLKAYLRAALAKYRPRADWVDECFQSFVLEKVMLKRIIDAADRNKGRFRDFMKKALLNFAIQKYKQEHKPWNTIEWPDSEEELEPERFDFQKPLLGDIEWARDVMRQALQRMKTECLKKNQALLWVVFKRRRLRTLRDGSKIESLTDTAAAVKRKFGVTLTIQQVSNLQTTADKKLRKHLLDVLSEYCRNAEEIEDELQSFLKSFSASTSLLPSSQTHSSTTTTNT